MTEQRRSRRSAEGVFRISPAEITLAKTMTALDPSAATIASRTFLGEKTEYVVACAGETLEVAGYDTSARGLAPGAGVVLHIDEHAAFVLGDE